MEKSIIRVRLRWKKKLKRKRIYCDNCKLQCHAKLCKGCNWTQYCSTSCQVAHWPFHKKVCGNKDQKDQKEEKPSMVKNCKSWIAQEIFESTDIFPKVLVRIIIEYSRDCYISTDKNKKPIPLGFKQRKTAMMAATIPYTSQVAVALDITGVWPTYGVICLTKISKGGKAVNDRKAVNDQYLMYQEECSCHMGVKENSSGELICRSIGFINCASRRNCPSIQSRPWIVESDRFVDIQTFSTRKISFIGQWNCICTMELNSKEVIICTMERDSIKHQYLFCLKEAETDDSINPINPMVISDDVIENPIAMITNQSKNDNIWNLWILSVFKYKITLYKFSFCIKDKKAIMISHSPHSQNPGNIIFSTPGAEAATTLQLWGDYVCFIAMNKLWFVHQDTNAKGQAPTGEPADLKKILKRSFFQIRIPQIKKKNLSMGVVVHNKK